MEQLDLSIIRVTIDYLLYFLITDRIIDASRNFSSVCYRLGGEVFERQHRMRDVASSIPGRVMPNTLTKVVMT